MGLRVYEFMSLQVCEFMSLQVCEFMSLQVCELVSFMLHHFLRHHHLAQVDGFGVINQSWVGRHILYMQRNTA